MPRETINPVGLFDNRKYGFSQIAVGEGSRIVTISGQVGWDKDEHIVGADLKQQTMLALENLRYAMQAAGGSLLRSTRPLPCEGRTPLPGKDGTMDDRSRSTAGPISLEKPREGLHWRSA